MLYERNTTFQNGQLNHKYNLTMKNTFDNTVKQSFKWYIQEKKEEKKSSIKKFCHSVHVFLHKKFCSFPVVQLQSSKKIKNGTPLQTPIVYNVQCGSKVRPVALFYTVKDPFGGQGCGPNGQAPPTLLLVNQLHTLQG